MAFHIENFFFVTPADAAVVKIEKKSIRIGMMSGRGKGREKKEKSKGGGRGIVCQKQQKTNVNEIFNDY